LKNIQEEAEKILKSIKKIPWVNKIYSVISNFLESLLWDIKDLKKKNQKLKDELNKLKWEQWKPEFKKTKKWSKNKKSNNISSEKERKKIDKKLNWNKWVWKRSKIKPKKIDEIIKSEVDKKDLPDDAIFKWYSKKTVEDVEIRVKTTEILREVWESKTKWRIIWKLLKWYEWNYWPQLKALIRILKFDNNMSWKKIEKLLKTIWINISCFKINEILIRDIDIFHEEKDKMYKAWLSNSIYQQTDSSKDLENWITKKLHVVCNDKYTTYHTTDSKDRLTILDVLNNFWKRKFVFDELAEKLLLKMKISKKTIEKLKNNIEERRIYKQIEIDVILNTVYNKSWKIIKQRILEAMAISAYNKQTNFPSIKILICDDAPEYKLLTELLWLCWVHDGRHYKKLEPLLSGNKKELKKFLWKYWSYYQELLLYKKTPTEKRKKELSDLFDKLFSTATKYEDLNKRISKTKKKKDQLLLVLDYPNIPLHNNLSEQAVKLNLRNRDVCLQTRTEEWTKAKNTFLSLFETCRKNWINTLEYMTDRILGLNKIPPLATFM